MKTVQSVPYFRDPSAGDLGGLMNYDQMQAMLNEPAPAAPAEPAPGAAPSEPAPAAQPNAANPNEPAPASPAAPAAPEPPKPWYETATQEEIFTHGLSKFDKPALLKSLGVPEHLIPAMDKIDPEIVKYAEFVAGGGNKNEYLRLTGTDFAGMGELQLLEMDIKEKNPGIDPQTLQIVLKRELAKYNLDRDAFVEGSEDAEYGKYLLKQDSAAIRQRYLDKQAGLKAPAAAPDTKAQERALLQTQITESVHNSAAVKNLQTTKKLTYGEGEDALQFEVTDLDGIVSQVVSASIDSGKPLSDTEITRLAKTVNYHRNQEAIEKAWLAHVKANADAKFQKEVRNVAPGVEVLPNGQQQNKSNATIIATEGKIMSHAEVFGN